MSGMPCWSGGTAADADRAGPPAVRAHRRDAARQRCAHGLSASRAPQEPHPCQRAGGAAPDRRPAGGRHRRRHARGAGFRRQRQCPHAAQCRRLDQPAAFRYRAGPAAGRASAAGHRNAGRDACRGGVRAGRSARRSAGPDHAARAGPGQVHRHARRRFAVPPLPQGLRRSRLSARGAVRGDVRLLRLPTGRLWLRRGPERSAGRPDAAASRRAAAAFRAGGSAPVRPDLSQVAPALGRGPPSDPSSAAGGGRETGTG